MQITEHIHAIKIPFKLQVNDEKTLDRFVYAYLIYGKKICLIDCGVSSSDSIIFDYLKKTGRTPEEISMLVLTHSHPDHIGGAVALRKGTGCQVAAHVGARPWIEDVELQYKERPILNFHSLVEGPVQVNHELRDGDNLDLGDGQTLKVIHTPGHSRGSVSLVYEEDSALFSGDAVPKTEAVPIYEEVLPSIRSIRKLKNIKDLRILFASWDEPCEGDRLYSLMDEGLTYFQYIHDVVRKQRNTVSSLNPMEVTASVLKSLGLPETALISIVVRSIEAHLRVIDHEDLLST